MTKIFTRYFFPDVVVQHTVEITFSLIPSLMGLLDILFLQRFYHWQSRLRAINIWIAHVCTINIHFPPGLLVIYTLYDHHRHQFTENKTLSFSSVINFVLNHVCMLILKLNWVFSYENCELGAKKFRLYWLAFALS